VQDTTYSYSDNECDGGGQHETYINYSILYLGTTNKSAIM